jgi:C4-type zinc ribbon domain
MTMEVTLRALADLSEVDRQLSGDGAPTGRAAHALEGRRAALREAIPGNFLAAYDALGRAGRRPAAVPLVRGAHCGGCYMRIPPQLDAFVRRGQSVCSCPHCRRLLYVAALPAESGDGDGNGSERPPKGGRPATESGTSSRKRRTPRATGAERKSRPT